MLKEYRPDDTTTPDILVGEEDECSSIAQIKNTSLCYYCTLDAGHSSKLHVAHDTNNRVVATWNDEDAKFQITRRPRR